MNKYQASDYAGTVTRVALGTMYLAHGLLKLLVFTPAGTAGFFESLGLPGLMAYLVMTAEIGGGLLLLAGWQSRIVALALIPVLVGSIVSVHGASGWLFSSQGGGWEYPAFLIAASVVQALLGDGAYSLSTLWRRVRINAGHPSLAN